MLPLLGRNRPINHPIDKKVMDSLRENSRYFIKILGDPREEGHGLVFTLKNIPFIDFKIHYDMEKKFLGRIYVMILEGKFEGQKFFYTSQKIELRYSGFFKKGRPFFTQVPLKKAGGDNGNVVLRLLNQDEGLIEECWKLDLEFLKVFFDPQEESWKVQVRPYGGSLIQMIFPPMRYNVILVKEQAELIFSVMKKIAQLIK